MKKIFLFVIAVILNIPAITFADKITPSPDPAAMEAQSRKMMKEIIQNAENGNLEAQKQVSFMYMMLTSASDKDIKESGLATSLADAVDKAVFWMRKAAEQGDMEYQSKLGTYYMGNWKFGPHGEIQTTQNFYEAAKWYKLAAEQGDAKAQNNLGGFYLDGRGVEKDVVQAYKWFYLASQQYPRIFQQNLSHVAEQLDDSQIAEAERLANEWLSSHNQNMNSNNRVGPTQPID